MKRSQVFLCAVLCGAPAHAETPSAASLKQADGAYAQRTDIAQARAALAAYQQAAATERADVEAYWKAARAAYWVGDHAESHIEKIAYFQQGINLAKEALKYDPNSVEAHFWLGVNYGSFGETKGVMKSLSLIKPIRREMAEVNRLNDRYNGGGGYRVLGVMDYKVPGIAGGSKKRALEELTKALAIDARDPFTHYYLAEYYHVVSDPEKSQAEWKTLQALVVAPELQPELEMLLGKGQKIFEK